jgi:hypothetical protein
MSAWEPLICELPVSHKVPDKAKIMLAGDSTTQVMTSLVDRVEAVWWC